MPEVILVLTPVFLLIGVWCAKVVIKKNKHIKLNEFLNKRLWR